MTFAVRPNVLVPGVLCLLTLVSCASGPAEVEAVQELPAEAESAEPTELDDPPPPTAPPTSTTPSTTSTTTSSTTTVAPTTTTLPEEEIDVLGPTMAGVGDWVAIRPAGERITDCDNDTTLGYSVDGTLVHRYEELGGLGGIRLFPGPYGQDAFVINCEESIERILVQGSAFIPEQGWPELANFPLYGPGSSSITFDFSADFGWSAGWFMAHGVDTSTTPATTELYGFDPANEKIVAIADRVGERTRVADLGADLVVPNGWLFDNGTAGHPDSLSRVQITGDVAAGYEPLAEGDDFLSSDSAEVRIWAAPDADGRASVVRVVTATDWTFLSNEGVRVVRLIPVGNDILEVELFADSGDGTIDQDLPWMVLDMVRVFER